MSYCRTQPYMKSRAAPAAPLTPGHNTQGTLISAAHMAQTSCSGMAPARAAKAGIASGVRRRRFSASNIVTIEKAPSLNASRRPVGIMVFVRWCQ